MLLLEVKGALQIHLADASPLALWGQKQPKPNVATGLTKGNCGPCLVPEVKGSLTEI